MITKNLSTGKYSIQIPVNDLDQLFEMQVGLIQVLDLASHAIQEGIQTKDFEFSRTLEILKHTLIDPDDIEWVGRDTKNRNGKVRYKEVID